MMPPNKSLQRTRPYLHPFPVPSSTSTNQTNPSVRFLTPLRQSAAKVIALICLCAVAQARDPFASSQALIFSEGGDSIPYRLFEPAGSIAAGTPVPLILFLHGAGERGTNNTSQVAFHI